MNLLIGGTLLTLIEGVGDYALKKYAIGGAWGFLPVGVTIYVVLAFVLSWLFKTKGFAGLNATWDGLSNIFTMTVGYLVFKEVYSLREWSGMFMITLGLFFMNSGKAHI
jgi:multidrug transporter EmrE-like cation transporter